jgi:protease YdgD
MLGLLLLVGCGERGQEASGLRNVFGRDDREVADTGKPWSAIGKTDWGCTATLVGRNLAVTAAHCIMDARTGKPATWVKTFYPDLRDGKAADEAAIDWVWWGTSRPDDDRAHDWAILRLTKPLGDKYGWYDVYEADVPFYSRIGVDLVGYSGDFHGGDTPGVHHACTIFSMEAGVLYHDCDMTRGASGGPMLRTVNGRDQIVALNVAELRDGGEVSLNLPGYSYEHANLAVPASAFAAALRPLLAP